ncbi:platelet-activating factor acetyltransferase activity [Sparganum proliferum]
MVFRPPNIPSAAEEPLSHFVKEVAGQQVVLFAVDSNASGIEWENLAVGGVRQLPSAHSNSYKQYIEPLHCLNFSIQNDQTQNVLWRILNGELDEIKVKICNGIKKIMQVIKEKQPNAYIIVMGLLPCGRESNPKRQKHAEVNKLLASEFTADSKVTFLCPDWDHFLQSDGTLSHRDMADYMHPTERAYARFCEPLVEELQNLLQIFLKTNAPPGSPLE